MQKSWLYVLVSCAFCASSIASDFYMGVGFKQQSPDFNDDETHLTGEQKSIGLYGGYQFKENLRLEVRAHTGTSGQKLVFWEPESNLKFDFEMAHQWELIAKPSFDITPELSFFGFAGINYTKFELNCVSHNFGNTNPDVISECFSSSVSDTLVTYGVGVSYQFNDNWSLFAEYQSFGDFESGKFKSELELDSVNVGVLYKF